MNGEIAANTNDGEPLVDRLMSAHAKDQNYMGTLNG